MLKEISSYVSRDRRNGTTGARCTDQIDVVSAATTVTRADHVREPAETLARCCARGHRRKCLFDRLENAENIDTSEVEFCCYRSYLLTKGLTVRQHALTHRILHKKRLLLLTVFTVPGGSISRRDTVYVWLVQCEHGCIDTVYDREQKFERQ